MARDERYKCFVYEGAKEPECFERKLEALGYFEDWARTRFRRTSSTARVQMARPAVVSRGRCADRSVGSATGDSRLDGLEPRHPDTIEGEAPPGAFGRRSDLRPDAKANRLAFLL